MGYNDVDLDNITIQELLRDHRKDRRTAAPEGVVTGSAEYFKWWRDNNKLRMRLYQKRAYLKKRKAILAMQKYEPKSAEELEAAITEVDEAIASLREIRAADVSLPPRATPGPKVEPVVVKKVEVPFIREMADLHNISYEEAERIMLAEDYAGEDSFTKDMSSRLEDIIGSPLDGGEKKG